MSTKDNGGPAFPVPLNPGETFNNFGPADGMSLRDYFAAKAMQGILAADNGRPMHLVVEDAFATADAMLAERGK